MVKVDRQRIIPEVTQQVRTMKTVPLCFGVTCGPGLGRLVGAQNNRIFLF